MAEAMMEEEELKRLSSDWINGNRSDVAETLRAMTPTGAALAVLLLAIGDCERVALRDWLEVMANNDGDAKPRGGSALLSEVDRYLDKPGCNVQSRSTAMGRLRWAAEEARKP